jgi:hypothetical protein
MAQVTGSRQAGIGALLALAASLVTMSLAATQAHSPVLYWVASSVALVVALAVLTAGERAWEKTLHEAQAAGLVERSG